MPAEPITVSQLNRLARGALERSIPLTWVSGEISNLTRAGSGHIYFTLKDETAQVRCVMFRSRAQLLPWQLENGQQVEAQALVTLYEARGDFQLNVEALRRGGLGRLFEAFARLKQKLEQEGLFDAARKRTLPRLPRCIGVVSSLQAAALRDIIAALKRRAPHIPIVLYPSPVQGEDAGRQIAAAITAAAAHGQSEVLILARGGGSIEDLWAFNEETVARAIVASPIPVISGVGHETDFTIADFAADLRAATPTAAAEMVSAGWFAAAAELFALEQTLRQAIRNTLDTRMQRVDLLIRGLLHPGQRLTRLSQQLAHLRTRLLAGVDRGLRGGESRCADMRLRLARLRPDPARRGAQLALLAQSLRGAWGQALTTRQHALRQTHAGLTALNPEATLGRGYSIVRNASGQLIRSAAELDVGERIAIRFARGGATGRVDAVE